MWQAAKIRLQGLRPPRCPHGQPALQNGKSRSLVVCPREDMRANFLGMTPVVVADWKTRGVATQTQTLAYLGEMPV